MDSLTPSELEDLLKFLSAEERAEMDLLLGREAGQTVLSFADYVEALNPRIGTRPGLMEYGHVPRLVDVGQRIVDTFETDADGEPLWTWEHGQPNYKRVMVLLPPRYYKSELFSRLLPGYFLYRFPRYHAGLASYSADLAWKLSANARANFRGVGGQIATDTDAKKLWQTAQGGEMWAAGIDGTITGSGFHLGIIDDPMKPKHATSRAFVSNFQAFWSDTWFNRQEPGAAMLLVMQRLGQDDPVDYLYRREIGDGTDEAPEHWHVVCCDEIKSDEPLARYNGVMGLPPTCTLEDDPRNTGDLLSPERFDAEEVAKQQAASMHAKAQRQQRPVAATGDFWKAEWFQVHDTLPDDAYNGGVDWDTAYTKDERNSANAYVKTFRGRGDKESFPIYIEDCDWQWLEFPELVTWMKSMPGPHSVEGKATGKSVVQVLKNQGVSAKEVRVNGGDKLARASGVQPIVSNMRISINERLVKKLLYGKHMDMKRNGRQGLLSITAEALAGDVGDLDLNDAFVQAINRHVADANSQRTIGETLPI